MSRFKANSFSESLGYALRGLKLAISSQKNFVIELIIGVIAFLLACAFGFSSSDKCILLITILIVLICEMLNSAIEFTLDAVYKNSYSKLVEMAKDISAGVVLLASIFSIIIGIILFLPYMAENIII